MKRSLRMLAAALPMAAMAFVPGALAQEFPSQPVELINSASPGGGSDIFMRLLASVSQEHFGGDFVVLSKSGGRAIVAMNYLNNRPKDGHTLMIFTPGQLLTLSRGDGPFKFEDVVPIAVGTVDPVVLVSKKGTFNDAKTLIEEGKKRKLKTGGTEAGNFEWMAVMAFVKESGVQPPIYLPLKGGGEVMLNVIGGTIDVGVGNLTEVTEQVKTGELEALLVMSEERSPALPDVPTAKELGMDLLMSQARGLIALKGTPEANVKKLEQAFMKGMQSEKYQEYLKSNGLGPDSIGDAEAWGNMMKRITATVVEIEKELRPETAKP